MPRYQPTGPTLSQETDQAFDAEWRAELTLTERREQFDAIKRKERVRVSEVSPYGARSEHSWFRDSAMAALPTPDAQAVERLNRHRAAMEKPEARAITTTSLGTIVAPGYNWTAETIAPAVRSAAPLYDALLKIPLPPTGTSVVFAHFTQGGVAVVQATQNAALTTQDLVEQDQTEPFSTIGTYFDYSFQASDRGGALVDEQLAADLLAAWAAKVESELWVGPGTGGRIRGLTAMTPTTSVAAGGQTAANQLSALWNAYSATTMALGRAPDLLVMHPRRAAWLAQAVAGAPMEFVPDGVQLVLSPAAPSTLGGGTEDWPFFLNRQLVPLATDGPQVEFQTEARGTELMARVLVYGYLVFATAHRPEAAGKVTGLTTPTFS